MTKDLNKKIAKISYNVLNLPNKLVIDSTTHVYTYTADGRKLRVQQGEDKRDYVGSVIYEDSSLKRILVDGGYAQKEGDGWKYYFYFNDHLGNNVVVADQDGNVIQNNSYYPFGLPMATASDSIQNLQPYKYNGKEFDRKDGLKLYDYGARHYDAQVGRFMTMDRYCEKYYSMSPYQYAANNPMKYIDVNGDSISLSALQSFDQAVGTSHTQQLITDLQNQTGLTLTIDSNGMLTYSVDSNGQPVVSTTQDANGNTIQTGSATARNLIVNSINHSDIVTTVVAQKSGVLPGTNELRLSRNQINSFINGANNVDNRTLGWGMTFMHELSHTQVGGGLSDTPGNPGPVATQMNIIRAELNALGGNYGQRADYYATNIGLYNYLPFEVSSQKLIRNSTVPIKGEKFIKFK